MTRPAGVGGFADGRFAPVADAFRRSLTDGGPGAAVTVVHRGVTVVDLWGGLADVRSGTPWAADTLAPLFSAGKGPAAVAALAAVARGWIGLDEPVSRTWPGFATRGKDGVTLRHILDHRSGLVVFGRRVDRHILADRAGMSALIEGMSPAWEPGTRWGYHIGTFGELLSGILRRADPQGRGFDRLFAEVVARPLGADLHFGVDDPRLFARIARVRLPTARDWARDLPKVPGGLWRKVLNPVSLLHRAGREILSVDPGDPDWIRLPFPSANAVGTTRAVAALYAEVAAGGAGLGLTPSVVDDLLAAPEIPPGGSRDRVMGVDGRWRLGFVRPGPAFAFSPSPRAFGMPGLGGSFGFADPDEGLAYCFAPAGLGVLPFDEPREKAIRAAVLKATRGG